MPFDDDDPYVTVECKILGISTSGKAVRIEDLSGLRIWVPRSVMHGGDERRIDDSIGDDVQLKIRRWFAEKEGLV